MSASHTWNAQEYYFNSSEQHKAADELLHYLMLRGNERILDVGCGDGKITAKIAGLVPKGSVLGIDLSPEMILFSQKRFQNSQFPNLNFLIQDAQNLNYGQQFDVVFSSFALQWVPDQGSFFKGAFKSLKPSGYLALTLPLSISLPLEQAVGEIKEMQEWKNYFVGFHTGWNYNQEPVFAELLKIHGFTPLRFEVIPQDAIFPSREALENYILQWFSYIKPLSGELKVVFFKQVMDRYFELEPIDSNGEAHLKFSRLEIIATKDAVTWIVPSN